MPLTSLICVNRRRAPGENRTNSAWGEASRKPALIFPIPNTFLAVAKRGYARISWAAMDLKHRRTAMVAMLASSRTFALDSGQAAGDRTFRPRRSAAPDQAVVDGVALLRQAAQAGHVSAMYRLGLESPDRSEREHWLREAAHVGYVPAMYAFGLTCEHPGCRRSWLRAAAEEGHVEAMYALTAELEDFDERKRWLEMAAEEGHVAAMYYWGLVCDDPRQRERWLTEAARNGCEAAAAELCDD